MAASTSRGTRKSSTSRATTSTSTSTSKSDADTTAAETSDTAGTADTATSTATAPDDSTAAAADSSTADDANTDANTDAADTAVVEQGDDATASTDPASALKAKLRTTQHIADTRPDDLTEEQQLNLVGAPRGAVPGPRTLSSPTMPTRRGEEYVTAETDGHIAFVPKNTRQPATTRVWVEGQRVRKDMFDALSAVVSPTPGEAPVLSSEQYAQLAPYL